MRQVLVHGLGQNSSSWDKTISALRERNDIDCPDMAMLIQGCECTYENIYRAFATYCWERNDAIHLCGLSLGAILALNFAIDHPEKVSSLILIAPQYKMPKLLLRIQTIIFKCMPSAALKGMGFDKREVIKLTNTMIDLNFTEQLKGISCPTLVVCGEKDRVNRGACEKIAHFLANAEVVIVEHAGHEVNVDAPEKLAEIIHLFFRKNPSLS